MAAIRARTITTWSNSVGAVDFPVAEGETAGATRRIAQPIIRTIRRRVHPTSAAIQAAAVQEVATAAVQAIAVAVRADRRVVRPAVAAAAVIDGTGALRSAFRARRDTPRSGAVLKTV